MYRAITGTTPWLPAVDISLTFPYDGDPMDGSGSVVDLIGHFNYTPNSRKMSIEILNWEYNTPIPVDENKTGVYGFWLVGRPDTGWDKVYATSIDTIRYPFTQCAYNAFGKTDNSGALYSLAVEPEWIRDSSHLMPTASVEEIRVAGKKLDLTKIKVYLSYRHTWRDLAGNNNPIVNVGANPLYLELHIPLSETGGVSIFGGIPPPLIGSSSTGNASACPLYTQTPCLTVILDVPYTYTPLVPWEMPLQRSMLSHSVETHYIVPGGGSVRLDYPTMSFTALDDDPVIGASNLDCEVVFNHWQGYIWHKVNTPVVPTTMTFKVFDPTRSVPFLACSLASSKLKFPSGFPVQGEGRHGRIILADYDSSDPKNKDPVLKTIYMYMDSSADMSMDWRPVSVSSLKIYNSLSDNAIFIEIVFSDLEQYFPSQIGHNNEYLFYQADATGGFKNPGLKVPLKYNYQELSGIILPVRP